MAQSISVTPAEQGTAKVVITCSDEDDAALNIGNLTTPQWQLMRTDGTIINSKTFANGVLSSLTFALSGDDLALFEDDDDRTRVLAFQATYDSSLGDDLPLKGECKFVIDAMLAQEDK